VTDDVMDGSPTRRGQPSWHVKENLGVAAFNDAILIECALYSILERHFKDKEYYPLLLQEFHRVRKSFDYTHFRR
jgi:farnesyl diphosphate synthase